MRRQLALWMTMVTLLLAGCGGSVQDLSVGQPAGPRDGASTATVRVKFPNVNAQAVGSTYRFVGLAADSRVLYGPTDRAAAPEVTLESVPVDVRAILVLPLENGRGEDAFAHRVELSSGLFVIDDPLAEDARAQSLETASDRATIGVGETTRFTATGVFLESFRYNLTNVVDWSVQPADVANITRDGVVTANSVGVANVGVSLGEVSATAPLTVLGTPTTLTLGSSVNPTVSGQSVTFTATLSNPRASGEVEFRDGTTLLGTSPLQNGAASFTTSELVPGEHRITAAYAGDATFAAATSTAFAQTVTTNRGGVSLGSSANPAVFGQAVSFTAMVGSTAPGSGTPTGTVTFRSGSDLLGSSMLVGGQARLTVSDLELGSTSITAEYSGDSRFDAGSSPALLQVVTAAPSSTVLSLLPSPSVFGQNVTLTAAVSVSGQPVASGSVEFRDGDAVLGTAALNAGQASLTTASLDAGSHNLSAVYAGSETYLTSQNSTTHVVAQATTSTSLSSSVAPSVFGQNVTFTASVDVMAPGQGQLTGTVTFKDGAATLGTAHVSDGAATLTVSDLTVATHSITARYDGAENFFASTSSQLDQVVGPAAPGVNLGSSSATSVFGQPVTFSAYVTHSGNVTPTGTVIFEVDREPIGKPVALINGQATLDFASLAPGDYEVIAYYSGDVNFSADQDSFTQTVGKASVEIALSSNPNPPALNTTATFTVAVSAKSPGAGVPTGTVSFSDETGTAAVGFPTSVDLVNGTATFTVTSVAALPTPNLRVDYSGDSSFINSQSLLDYQPRYTSKVSISASNETPRFGEPVTLTADITAPGGSIDGEVQFVIYSAAFDRTLEATLPVSGASTAQAKFVLQGNNYATIRGNSITARYVNKSGNVAGSVSPAKELYVDEARTSISASITPASPVAGQPFQVDLTLSPEAPTTSTLRNGFILWHFQEVSGNQTTGPAFGGDGVDYDRANISFTATISKPGDFRLFLSHQGSQEFSGSHQYAITVKPADMP